MLRIPCVVYPLTCTIENTSIPSLFHFESMIGPLFLEQKIWPCKCSIFDQIIHSWSSCFIQCLVSRSFPFSEVEQKNCKSTAFIVKKKNFGRFFVKIWHLNKCFKKRHHFEMCIQFNKCQLFVPCTFCYFIVILYNIR